ncbi:hypothetical protein [Desulfosporosinus nitroreducens]|uniref:Lipoprotein n=1 Tax=Desulfosporosinus nitroreducens TaxID=2018668 RepID=A0ABT8QZV0_9FIRM|nr:hypothetical protein [Desulfosporosinus nitroreducens]MDO0825543.1 hypothetical protein [Desulfosporosinus nitroreducens]
MKKVTVLLLAICLMMSLVGCSGGNKTDDQSKGTAQMGLAPADHNAKTIYGKVTNIIGNDVELMLGNMPEVEEVESETIIDDPDGDIAVAAKPAVDANAGPFELEYTDETLTITVFAGLPITNMGEELSLSSIKNGTILALVVEDVKAETLTLEAIHIVAN